MSDKKQVHVIITAPFKTNRGWLARLLGDDLKARGVERVDLSNVPLIDIESPYNVEKGPVISDHAVFRMTEHQLCRQFKLDPDSEEPPVVCRPPVEMRFGGGGIGIAVVSEVNRGKSTIMKLMVECLNETPATRSIALGIATLGEEPLPSAWMARDSVSRLNENEIEVVFHVRRAIIHSSLEQLLDSCDKPQVAEE